MDDIDKIQPFLYESTDSSDLSSSDITSRNENEEAVSVKNYVKAQSSIHDRGKMDVKDWYTCKLKII